MNENNVTAMGVQTFREDRAEETEFMTISRGSDEQLHRQRPRQIHHLERDKEFLIEPASVQILKLRHGDIGAE